GGARRCAGWRGTAFRSSTERRGGSVAAGRLGRVGARVLRDEVRDLLSVLAGHDVLRHRAGGEAAVLDRVQDVVGRLLALIEVRAVLVLARLDLRRRALGAGGRERVAARAVLDEQRRALVVRVALGQLDARGAAAGERERGGAQRERGELSGSGEAHERRTAYGTIPRPHAL